jgi:arylsulfatase A-like enzyme
MRCSLSRLLAAMFVVSTITSIAAAQDGRESRRPNIVFVLLDNCGKEWFGCYGSEEQCTPHIDRLAREGLRVEHCYTPPVCGPSRIVALTGRYLLRSGMVLHHDAALYSGGGLDPRREKTFARLLRDAGYRTCISGKWQINNLYDEPDIIQQHGFDESLVWPGSIDRDRVSAAAFRDFQEAVLAADFEMTSHFISHIESRYWDPVLLRNGTTRERYAGQFGPDVLHQFAVDFLRREHRQPFLLYVPLVLTHGQTFLDPTVRTPLNRDRDRSHPEIYRDMVRYADDLVGKLIDELERSGLRENTIVFVATDNGSEKSFSAQANGRRVQGGLYQLTEAGSDVPLLVNCPARVPGGRTIGLADFSDLLPTFCELAGVTIPDDLTLDGRSFAGAILGRDESGPRQWIFNQSGDRRVVRDSQYKLYSDGALFDVVHDPDEQQNLSGSDEPSARVARRRLQDALDSLPADSPPPFELRSQSAFRLKRERAGKDKE